MLHTSRAGSTGLQPFHHHTHEFVTEGEFYGEWFKIRVEYQNDLDGPAIDRVLVYRDEKVAYDPDGRYRPHEERHIADFTVLLTESQRMELTREINDMLTQIE